MLASTQICISSLTYNLLYIGAGKKSQKIFFFFFFFFFFFLKLNVFLKFFFFFFFFFFLSRGLGCLPAPKLVKYRN